jgi:hypothetical protein
MMKVETRPDLHDLSDDQRILGLASRYTFLAVNHKDRRMFGDGYAEQWLTCLDGRMDSETRHRLDMAIDRYHRERAAASMPAQLTLAMPAQLTLAQTRFDEVA